MQKYFNVISHIIFFVLMSTSIEHRACRHIVDNFALFGFDSVESSIVQATKELIENSIDACRLRSINYPQIFIHLRDSPNPTFITVEVSDNGCGIRDPKAILSCFASTKSVSSPHGDNDDINNTGKFGVGISACLMYSWMRTSQPMRIVSKCLETGCVVAADYKFNFDAGKPIVLQKNESAPLHMLSGTKVTLCLPRADDMTEVIDGLHNLLNRYVLLPNLHAAQICFDVKVGSIVQVYHYRQPESMAIPSNTTCSNTSQSWNHEMTKEVRLDILRCAMEYYAGCSCELLNGSRASKIDHYRCNHVSSTQMIVEAKETTDSNSAESSVQLYAVVVDAPVRQCNDLGERYLDDSDHSDGDESLDTSMSKYTIPLTLLRYVNEAPLLDLRQDAQACSLVHCVQSFNWSRLGYNLVKMPKRDNIKPPAIVPEKQHTCEISSDRSSSSICLEVDITELSAVADTAEHEKKVQKEGALVTTPSWILESMVDRSLNEDDSDDLAQSNCLPGHLPVALYLIIDISTKSVPFSNMKKTSLTLSKNIQIQINKGVADLFSQLSSKTKNLFLSRSEIEDEEFEGCCSDLFNGLPVTEDTEESWCTELTQVMRDCIRPRPLEGSESDMCEVKCNEDIPTCA